MNNLGYLNRSGVFFPAFGFLFLFMFMPLLFLPLLLHMKNDKFCIGWLDNSWTTSTKETSTFLGLSLFLFFDSFLDLLLESGKKSATAFSERTIKSNLVNETHRCFWSYSGCWMSVTNPVKKRTKLRMNPTTNWRRRRTTTRKRKIYSGCVYASFFLYLRNRILESTCSGRRTAEYSYSVGIRTGCPLVTI